MTDTTWSRHAGDIADHVTERIEAVVMILDDHPELAESSATLRKALGCSVAQLKRVLYEVDDTRARDAWDRAREWLATERCKERRCSICRITKEADQFPKDRTDPCGIARKCHVCNRAAVRLYEQRRRNA